MMLLGFMQQAARGGVTPALHNIANAYAEGLGVDQSDRNALLFYEAAVEAGDPSAKFTLGTWLYAGKGGLTIDKERSFQLQLEAANAGHPLAMFNTGAAYMEGSGVKSDLAAAVEWFERAAERNILQAAINASNMYRLGDGVTKDLRKARSLLANFEHSGDELCLELIKHIDSLMEEES